MKIRKKNHFIHFLWTIYNKKNNYEYFNTPIPYLTVGDQDPVKYEWNSFKSKLKYMKENNISVFSIHRKSLTVLDLEYKKNLIKLYKDIFKDNKVKTILIKLLNVF